MGKEIENIRFNKDLSEEVRTTISDLEDAFSEVFENMVYFSEELDKHNGKAAKALQKKMSDHISFFSKASCCLLYFADSMQCFAKAVELTDASEELVNVTPVSRSERKHTFSAGRVEDEIKVNSESLNHAIGSFGSNLSSLDRVLHYFDNALRKMMNETEFPWEDVSKVWSDAKSQINSVITEIKNRVQELAVNAENIVKELSRVDNLISKQVANAK
ncbi:hypothetical protein PJ311_01100 [Bacillus sp. CLL-7-23]|uniref:Uncharacterized protein n=1 Tax=Bacillus changyiensis TaxID=3004103 RepID=A0ABT4WYS7_9BACI|nr:hypothetical protein [Bacillus changyiensis]MDA7025201.1 hypothetical protein [Bacillus changyiensis]